MVLMGEPEVEARSTVGRTAWVVAIVVAVAIVGASVVLVARWTQKHAAADQHSATVDWGDVALAPNSVVRNEASGQDLDEPVTFWARRFTAPAGASSAVLSAYDNRFQAAGWTLHESIAGSSGGAPTRLCWTRQNNGETQVADLRTMDLSEAAAVPGELEIILSSWGASNLGPRCGDAGGFVTWPQPEKPAA